MKSEKINLKKLFNKNFILIISALILFCLLSVVMFNDLSHYFSLFFKGNEAAFKQVVLIKKMVENTPSIIYYPFKLVIEILRITLAPIILIFIYNSNFKEKIKIFLSFIFILILLCISSQEQINSILIVFACALLIVKLYPNYSKVFMIIGSILIILFVTFGLVTFSGIDDFDRMSQVLQAYFSGPSNVALGITIGRSKALDFFLGDFFRNIPIFATFFKNMIVTNDYMNIVGSLSGGASITPFISDGYIYFGKILSILPTMVITYIIIKLEKNLYNNNYDVYTYFIRSISIIIIALCPVLYSVGIFYSYIMSIIIPINILDYIRTNVLKISFDKEGLHNAYKKISN